LNKGSLRFGDLSPRTENRIREARAGLLRPHSEPNAHTAHTGGGPPAKLRGPLFLGFFALVGLPVSYGVGAIARAVPWAGLATCAALALAGLLTLLGRQLRVPMHLGMQPRRERRLGAMLLFGMGYGAASLAFVHLTGSIS
jgi:hypothetical protein